MRCPSYLVKILHHPQAKVVLELCLMLVAVEVSEAGPKIILYIGVEY
jgi:hypothetical protein